MFLLEEIANDLRLSLAAMQVAAYRTRSITILNMACR
jgi:hypothetical protein